MRSLFVVAILLATPVAPAAAADAQWVITASGSQTIVFIDDASITRSESEGMASAKMITTFATPLLGKYSSQMMTVEYDCADPRYRESGSIFTDRNGEILTRAPSNNVGKWYPVNDKTVDETTRNHVCYGGPVEGRSSDPLADSKKKFGW